MSAAPDDWWSALPFTERLQMNRLMFAPLSRVAHVGLYFVLWMLAEAANDNGDWPPPRAG